MDAELENLIFEIIDNFEGGLLDIVGGMIIVLFIIYFIYKLIRSIRLVPTKSAYIVERLGKYSKTLEAGFHPLLPFIDKVAFIQDLKEVTIPVPPQDCFTMDNVKVEVDGVIYISVVNPVNASYGVTNYKFAATQLAQTTTRSVIGTIDLDRTFEERDLISTKVLEVMADVEEAWGIKVHRYEIKNIIPPATVKRAMEQQMTAERDRRALIYKSEGDMQSRINRSEGIMAEMINKSQGEMKRRINEAEGKAKEIETISNATAQSIELLADSLVEEGGMEAIRLRLTQEYLKNLSNIANPETNVLLPADLTKLDELLNTIGLTMKKNTKS